MPIASVNPATGDTLATFAAHTDAEVDARLDRAAAAFAKWRRERPEVRAGLLARTADVLLARRDELARLMTAEVGKLIGAARAEVEKCATCCRYYAENGPLLLADVRVGTEAKQSFIRRDPLGAVLAVMPWNFPFWQVIRFAAPALVAGNVGLLKHASNVPQCALALEDVFRAAGAPDGVFQALLVEGSRASALLGDARIAAATLTGSDAAGRSLAQAAGKALKKTVLELGGSDPFLVLPSADLDAAVSTAVQARVQNAGQSCIAAKRFIVHESVFDRFAEGFTARMRALRVGDPLEPSTEIGPLATGQVLHDVEAQVDATVRAGARVACGGKRVSGSGFFYEPTVLLDVPAGSPAAADEVFGPVAALFPVRDLDEAIRLANGTPFGLGAAAFTRDDAEMKRLVAELEAGSVFVNAMVKSDPRVPFGGIKASGYGRELSREGLFEFTNAKTVWIA